MEYVRGRLGLTLLASVFLEVYTRHPGALAFGTCKRREREERGRERERERAREREREGEEKEYTKRK